MVMVMVMMGRGGVFEVVRGGGDGDGGVGGGDCGMGSGGEREESSGVIIAPTLLASGFNTEREI